MAAVDILAAFEYEWAENGIVEALDDAQYKAGWAFIGSTPPSVEQFNKVHQILDQKANWLFGQVKAVADSAGVVLTPADMTALLTLLRGRFLGTTILTSGSGSWIVPDNVRRLEVEMWGGGGGGGGGNQPGSAAGGGGGGYAYGIVDVVPGQSLSYMVGAFGPGGTNVPTSGTAGGLSIFGTTLSATGGGGGQLNLGGISNLPGAGGMGSGSGSLLNVVGSSGGQGYQTTTGYTGGLGGSSYMASVSLQNVASAGVPGIAPGAGGSGAAGNFGGGNGAPGLIKIRKFA